MGESKSPTKGARGAVLFNTNTGLQSGICETAASHTAGPRLQPSSLPLSTATRFMHLWLAGLKFTPATLAWLWVRRTQTSRDLVELPLPTKGNEKPETDSTKQETWDRQGCFLNSHDVL